MSVPTPEEVHVMKGRLENLAKRASVNAEPEVAKTAEDAIAMLDQFLPAEEVEEEVEEDVEEDDPDEAGKKKVVKKVVKKKVSRRK